MPDVLVFGATGYTGKLVVDALQRRGASFAIAGRSRARLEALSEVVGGCDVRVASVGETESLVRALEDCRVLLTCVGPFVEHGWTAVEAALEARVHYLDSTGEGVFVGELATRYDGAARKAGIVMAPAMGFDEVPGDVAATLAAEGLDHPELVLTYALPTQSSLGTLISGLGILASRGPWIVDGRRTTIRAGQHHRWAPMPPPLGPKDSVSFPLAVTHLVPMHLDLQTLKCFVTTDPLVSLALQYAWPLYGTAYSFPPTRRALENLAKLLQRNEGPDASARRKSKFTILAEARTQTDWKNVSVQGADPYGLTAEIMAAAALRMAEPSYERSGVLSPVQAADLDFLEKQLVEQGIKIEVYGRR